MKVLTLKLCKLLILFLLLTLEPSYRCLYLKTAHANGGSAFNMAFWQKKKESQWIKTLGGTGFDYVRHGAVDANGNVYVSGKYTNDGTNTNLVTDFKNVTLNGRGDVNGFVAKLDKDGVQIWIKTIGGTSAEEISGLELDGSGNIYVTGTYANNIANANTVLDFSGANLPGVSASTSFDIFVAKLDTNGNQLWIKKMGGTSTDEYPVLTVDSSGNVYVGGKYTNSAANANSVIDFSAAPLPGVTASSTNDLFIAKLNTSGVQQWIKTMGGTFSEVPSAVYVDSSGNVFIAGSYINDTSNSRNTVDFAGNILLGIMTTITFYSDNFIAKLNSSGVQQWIKTIGGEDSERISAIDDAGGGSIYLGGYYENTTADVNGVKDFSGAVLLGKTAANYADSYIAKLDTNGNQQWIKTMGGTSEDMIYGLESDGSYNIYVCGGFWNTPADATAFKDFSGTTRLGAGNSDIFVTKLDSSGTQEWFKTMGGVNAESCFNLDFSYGTIYMPGNFTNNSANVNNVKDIWGNNLPGKTATTSFDIFILKFVP